MSKTPVVAIVDDDQSVREALTSLVRSLGYGAIAFECAEDLLKSKRRRHVSCLIADVQMPGMTGPELHHRLVSTGGPIPTILITAFPDERARERALQAGVICYLAKPFSEDDLLACIRSTLRPHQADGRGSRESAGPSDLIARRSHRRPEVPRPARRRSQRAHLPTRRGLHHLRISKRGSGAAGAGRRGGRSVSPPHRTRLIADRPSTRRGNNIFVTACDHVESNSEVADALRRTAQRLDRWLMAGERSHPPRGTIGRDRSQPGTARSFVQLLRPVQGYLENLGRSLR